MELDYRPVFKYAGKTKIEEKKPYSNVNSTLPGYHFQHSLSDDYSVWFLFEPKPNGPPPVYIEI
ncbi:hypothetical protein [Jiulongibacter sediminis]|uniref:hypothetical protein n=1 Tax=Jiulongibacter sediminis TaxID=1605367 RepID=UPI0026EB750E|nr:hypothetical protein [Jiulongibacter sediminis]